MKHIKGLDTLRAFAVFAVIFTHFGVWFDDSTFSGKFFKHVILPDGGFGVNLFFVLSGFLITSILLKAKSGTASHGAIIKQFYVRRALRIFPIYYITLFLLCAVGYPDIRQYFWYFATYTSNLLSFRTGSWNAYSHTWTLSVEEQFYLLWPWLIVFINGRYVKYALWGVVSIGVAFLLVGNVIFPGRMPLLVFNSFDAFGLGGVFAWSMQREEARKRFTLAIKILAVPSLCIYYTWRYIDISAQWYQGLFWVKPAEDIISMWLIVLVVNCKPGLIKQYLLDNKALNYLGKISYGLYLYHYPYNAYFRDKVNDLLFAKSNNHPTLSRILHNHSINYWLHISILIAISAISFYFIEKPFLRLKKHFRYNSDENVAAKPL